MNIPLNHSTNVIRTFTRLSVFACMPLLASAQALEWWPGGTEGGTADWQDSNAWSADGGSTFQNWVNGSDAVFSGTAGTAIVTSSGLSIDDLQVNTSGYQIRFGTGNYTYTVASFSGTALADTRIFSPTGSILTLGLTVDAGNTANYTGYINDAGTGVLTLDKRGNGTLRLSSNLNEYAGGTYVTAGNLIVNNTSGSGVGPGQVIVQAEATFGGTGIITLDANNSVTNNGILIVGDGASAASFSINTSGTGELLMNTASSLELDIWANSINGADNLAITGAATIGPNVTLDVANSGSIVLSAGNQFNLFDWGSSPEGTFTTISLPTLDGGLTWDTSSLYTTGIIGVTAIPEPSSIYFMGAIIMAIAMRYRNSRSR